ncbi:rab-GTPase-TBC domain protein (macronuclear) [Tetrahymena thermophila SB210]|uniref:Rab-GTPase-TBC domain protein n=1 Tax=Tetrahymena thermophila (strain SB210) TaxID=312017 RepID=Q23ZD1_TETTS|nr:rab-GTPase-TBC domain protein [Tetrahymena thermophila SB210]EAS01926.2 rab-GTPase-TBC domain protein [Tetrahymena thermophila SB210]|eukprot:XP_001022171.2 rab-GTPase-TBC domain protein [Tetrahymena thermophila SB210]
MSIFNKIKRVFSDKSEEEEKKSHSDIVNKVNFTQIYNKNEDYVRIEDSNIEESNNETRIKKFQEIINQRIIDYDKLKALSWDGIPQCVRGKAWRVLLKYLPTNKDTQEAVIARKRKDYKDMVATYLENINENERDTNEQKGLDQVIKDVERTVPNSKLFRNNKIKEILIRILFIWNVRHPASGYVQGMNDVLSTFIIVFVGEYCVLDLETLDIPSNFDKLTDDQFSEIEADSYWCLSKILDGMLDNYTNNFPGVKKQFEKVQLVLKRLDNDLLEHITSRLDNFYQEVFKCSICLLLRQFSIKVGLRLFDTYVSDDSQISQYFIYLYSAIILKWSLKIKKLKHEEDIINFFKELPTTLWNESDLKVILAEAYVYKTLFETGQKYN